MSIDLTQQALNALADAGLGNDSPAEAYVIGYTQGHDDALALAIQLERSINRRPFMPDEAERLAMRLHEQVGDCPIAHESGKAMDDSEREWWVNLAASAWTLIDGTHPECFGRFTVVALSYGGVLRKCMRRVAQMCAKHSACEQLDRQEARA